MLVPRHHLLLPRQWPALPHCHPHWLVWLPTRMPHFTPPSLPGLLYCNLHCCVYEMENRGWISGELGQFKGVGNLFFRLLLFYPLRLSPSNIWFLPCPLKFFRQRYYAFSSECRFEERFQRQGISYKHILCMKCLEFRKSCLILTNTTCNICKGNQDTLIPHTKKWALIEYRQKTAHEQLNNRPKLN